MLLREIHESLNAHFTELREQREEIISPIFALEHNLTPSDLDELNQLILQHLSTSPPDARCWLPWVVYATEIGYEFEGHEYWQTFEEKTLRWRQRGERAFIRKCFRMFVQSFNGFTPTGVWADHFNIIAFPITHAILPKDFQFQLSRVLFQIREYMNPSIVRSPQVLGKKIYDHSYDESKRFQRFAQNFDLVGLIAREILTNDELGSDNVILPTTFRRIIADLRDQGEAAYFVDQTRSAIKDKSQTRSKKAVQVRPRLVLHRREPELWEVLVEILDLQGLLELSGEAEQFLLSAKPRIAGSLEQARLARGQLVNFGATVRALDSLPANDQQLVLFRRDIPSSLEEVFRKQLVLNLPRFAVFRAQSSGIANQMHAGRVNQADDFLVLSRELVSDNPLLRQIKTTCKNAYMYSLQSKLLCESDYLDALEKLGLHIDQEIELVPVSPPPLRWDEGTSLEYLDGESPCFAIRINQSWNALRIRLDDFDVLEIEGPIESPFTYFCLPKLSTGLYTLSYSIRSDSSSDFGSPIEISLFVRDRTTWRSGTTNQNALILLLDPPKPSFEKLLAGEVQISVLCAETPVSIGLRLLPTKSSEPPLLVKNLGGATLPSELEKARDKIETALEDENVLEFAELTHLCQLEFRSDELGSVNIDFRREFDPLRWEITYNQQRATILNLADESFGDEKTEILAFTFENPDAGVRLEYDDCFPDYEVPVVGGLFVARTPTQQKGIVVLKEDKIKAYKSFSDIGKDDGFEPRLRTWERTNESLSKLMDLYSLWSHSRSVGGIFSRKDVRKVLDAFLFKIVCLIDGYQWGAWELRFVRDANSRTKREAAADGVSPKASVRTGLKKLSLNDRSPEDLVDDVTAIFRSEITPERIVSGRTVGKVKVVKTLDQEWFVEFALRLCSRPETVKHWCQTEERFEIGLKKMLDNPALSRAARFIFLALRQNTRTYRWDWE